MKKPTNLSNDSNEIKQVANGRLCCAIRYRRFTVSTGWSSARRFRTALRQLLVIFIGVMDMLENTDDAGGKTDRIVEV